MNFEKLKETARKYEQKEEWRRAIEVYLQAIREFEAGNDPVPDLSVYNRIGDLYLKANEPGAAVQAYERAADLYGEQGFYNNAIALCGKILRVNPGRIQTYLKLAQLHARKNVVIEAKKNLLEYLERMNALSQLDEAFKSVKDFADQFPANKEIRLMLSELLRASSRNAEAREQLEKLASDLEARGDTIGARKTLMRLQAIESEDGAPVTEAPKAAPGPRPRSADLVFLDIGASSVSATPAKPTGPPSRKTRAVVIPPGGRATTQTRAPSGLPLIDVGEEPAAAAKPPVAPEPLAIETSSLVESPIELESVQKISDEAVLEASASGEIAKALGFEPTEVEGLDQITVQPLDGLEVDRAGPEAEELHVSVDGLDLERTSEPDPIAEPMHPVHTDSFLTPDPLDMQSELSDDLSMGLIEVTPTESALTISGMDLLGPSMDEADIDPATDEEAITFLDPSEPEAPSIVELEDRVLEDPDDPEAHRTLGEALLATGETLRGQEELELALAGYEGREDWGRAADLIQELIRLDPNGVRYHQKLVEIAFRSGDRAKLIDAYLELADALLRVGALDKALAVYRRVSEHDPGNRRALAALDALAPAEDEYPIPPAPAAAPEPPTEELDQALEAAFDAPPPRPSGRKSRTSVPTPRAPEPEPLDLGGDFIDLGALVMDDDRVKDTRMRVEDEEPTGDEAKDFQEMLQAFKRGIDENIEAEDYQAHYDLGVAFKEMGLLDEAISEFQKALRAPEGRLKTSEALGTAFYEKGQFAIAEAILKRAVESLGATDDEQIGLIYWLARSLEAQGKAEPAITAYERVMAVEIRFMDASERMTRLSGGRTR